MVAMIRTVFFCCLGIVLAFGKESDRVKLPTFVFPEDGDAYFGKNVRALQSSLHQAIDEGCLDSWPLTHPKEIAIVFRHDGFVPESSDFYIQYQMEQIAASQDQPGLVSFSHQPQYKEKLGGALQVWEWSPRHLDYLNNNLPGVAARKINYVPLWSSVDIDNAPAACVEILDQPSCQAEADVDVLFFGAMTEARKKLCHKVDAAVTRLELHGRPTSHECVTGVFGAELECKICKAKVIYSDHSRPSAVLEVHRINPLLALGKAVVSASSADNALDAMYGGALKLLATEKIPKAISSLLLNSAERMELEHGAYDLAQRMKLEAQPHVCQALKALASIAGESGLPSARQGLQNYVPYSFERRLAMDNMTNSSNSTLGENFSSNMSSVDHPERNLRTLRLGGSATRRGVDLPATPTSPPTSIRALEQAHSDHCHRGAPIALCLSVVALIAQSRSHLWL